MSASTHRPCSASAAAKPDPALRESYVRALLAGPSETSDLRLEGLCVALDAGNGAAAPIAQRLFESAGAQVTITGDRPDGQNVNRGCGSTEPAVLAALVRRHGCDIGFAFDGDADRVIACDERGDIRDGDDLLWVWARDLDQRRLLENKAVVATTMSNLGLDRALAAAGIGVVRCGVGDRRVVETLRRRGLSLGGETSGHLINLALSTTGDGLLTALHIAGVLKRWQRAASELFSGLERNPQILRSVRVRSKPDLATVPGLQPMVRSIEDSLGDRGRLVLRYSGTEPLVRIMIEGPEHEQIERLTSQLAEALQQHLG